MISATCGGTISSQLSSPVGDALEHVTRKDRQIFQVEIIELHETAAAYQVIIRQRFPEGYSKRTLCNASLGGGVNSAPWDGQ
jgi:hypothetical protein